MKHLDRVVNVVMAAVASYISVAFMMMFMAPASMLLMLSAMVMMMMYMEVFDF